MPTLIISFPLVIIPCCAYVNSIDRNACFSSRVNRCVAGSFPICFTAFRTASSISSSVSGIVVSWLLGIVVSITVSWCRDTTVSRSLCAFLVGATLITFGSRGLCSLCAGRGDGTWVSSWVDGDGLVGKKPDCPRNSFVILVISSFFLVMEITPALSSHRRLLLWRAG